MSKQNPWNWFVWGKHPGVPDFICAGEQTQLFQRFTRWVDTGFSRISAELKSKSRHCSWRFWSKGANDQVVCGLVRNSCDSYGRSFPLLYLGSGGLENWQRNCSLLPFAFESVWKHFEYAAAARYESVARLNETLQTIEAPVPQWRLYQERIHSKPVLHTHSICDETVENNKRLYRLNCQFPEDLPHDLSFCSNIVAATKLALPTAVFISEVDEHIAVAIIENMLMPAEFAWLWSIQKYTQQDNGLKTIRKEKNEQSQLFFIKKPNLESP
jgi:type VI secretion system ImpM family protein